jgi:cytochrome c oxidase cbb3-type subunit III
MTGITRAHAYDGITEFDNRLPNWWLWSFYLACIFSIGYWVHYHSLGTGDLPSEAYVAEQQAAAALIEAQLAANPVTDEMLRKLASEPAFVAEGARIFRDANQCSQCHGPDGGAFQKAGANLTDDHWIYGGAPMELFTTIRNGRAYDAARGTLGGMPEQGSKGLGFVLRATAFVLSIRNTNAKPGKAPEAYAVRAQ